MRSKISKSRETRKKVMTRLLDGFDDDPSAEKINSINEERLTRAINKVAGSKLKPIDTKCLIKKAD
jgi:hypothetical protein